MAHILIAQMQEDSVAPAILNGATNLSMILIAAALHMTTALQVTAMKIPNNVDATTHYGRKFAILYENRCMHCKGPA